MDTVVQALNVLYRQPDATGKEKASAYLNDVQKSVIRRQKNRRTGVSNV